MTTLTGKTPLEAINRFLFRQGVKPPEAQTLLDQGQTVTFKAGDKIDLPQGTFNPHLVIQGKLQVQGKAQFIETGDVISELFHEHAINSLVIVSNEATLMAFSQANPLLKKLGQRSYRNLVQHTPNGGASQNNNTLASVNRISASDNTVNLSLVGYTKLMFNDGFFTSQMIASALLLQLFMLAMPIFYMAIFNHVFGHQNLNTLNVMAIGMVLVLGLEVLCKHGRGLVMSNQLEWLDKVSIQNVLSRLAKLPALEQTNQITQGKLSTLVAELVRNNQVIATSILMSFMDGIFGLLLMGFLILLNPVLAIISISALIPILVITLFITPKIQHNQNQQQQVQQRLQLKITEVLQQAEGLKLANAANQAITDVTQQGFSAFENQTSSRFHRIAGLPLIGFFINLASVLTLYFGAHEVLEGRMSYGVYMAINMLSRTVLSTMQNFLQSIMQFKQASESANEMGRLLNSLEKSNQQNSLIQNRNYFTPEDIHGHLGVKNLSFTYADQNNLVFEHAQLSIKAGEKVVITGANGSGKTTLLRLLSGIVQPNNGQVTLDGMAVEEIQPDVLSQFVGGIFHRPAIVANTIKYNLLLANPNAPMQTVTQAIELVGLQEIFSKMPKGLETELAPFGSNVSTGVLARLALARLIIHNPEVMLIDEVINAIDPNSAREIIQSLFNLYPEKTMVIISADPNIQQMANTVYQIQNGQIIQGALVRNTQPKLVQ